MKTYIILMLILISGKELFGNSTGIEIYNQSKGETVCRNAAVTLFVDAGDRFHNHFTYQWYFQNRIISNAVSSRLEIDNADYSSSGIYYCMVKSSDDTDSLRSANIPLYVITPTEIISEPEDIHIIPKTFSENLRLQFKAHVNGLSLNEAQSAGLYIGINWFLNTKSGNTALNDDDSYAGVHSEELKINSHIIQDTNYYFAVINGQCGSDTTRICRIINDSWKLRWITQPDDVFICENNRIKLNAIAVSSLNFTIKFHWYKNGLIVDDIDNEISGATTSELTIFHGNNSNQGEYSLKAWIEETGDTIVTRKAEVLVDKSPEITEFPKSKIFHGGEDAIIYHIGITKQNKPCRFELFKDNKKIYECYGSACDYHVSDIDSNVAGYYNCVVSNTCGTVSSDKVYIEFDDLYWVEKPLTQFGCSGPGGVVLIGYAETHSDLKVLYQWYHEDGTEVQDNDTDILGAKATHLIFSTMKTEYTGRYYLKVWLNGTDKKLFSDTIDLGLNQGVIVTRQPVSKTVAFGTSDTLFHIETFPDGMPQYITLTQYLPAADTFRAVFLGSIKNNVYDYVVDKIVDSLSGYYYADLSNQCGTIRTDEIEISIQKNIINSVSAEITYKNDLNIYPNPADYEISIFSPKLRPGDLLTIYDVWGNLVLTEKFLSHAINVTELSPGTYFLRCNAGKMLFIVTR